MAMAVVVPTERTSRSLERFAWFAVGYNVLVVLWGALVRATGSGAGCGNHWPLCNGQVVPVSPRVDTIIEFTHRMMTSGSIFIVLALLIWVFRAFHKGQAARAAAVASTILLVNEAILGALLVKLGYVTGNQSLGRVVMLSIHLGNTLLLIAALTLTAVFVGTHQWTRLMRFRSHWGLVLIGLLATMIVGVSGSLAALGDTLFPAASLRVAMEQDFASGSPLLLRLRGVHPLSVIVSTAFVFWMVVKGRRAGDGPLGNLVVGLLSAQIVVGVADVVLLAPTWIQIVHLFIADLYWIALIVLAARLLWPLADTRTPAR